jgi:thiol-disulfide isomerase/thioredoxin
MKYFLSFLTVALFSMPLFSQADNYEPAHEGWLVTVEEAYQESQKTGKPIMAYFTGSDWCPPCRRFSAAVINQPEFNKWANDKVVLLELDNPRRKAVPDQIRQQNESMRQAFNVTGVPTIWVFNLNKNQSNGQFEIEAIGRTSFVGSLDAFTETIEGMLN